MYDDKILEELSEAIESRVVNHRNSFFKILTNRYYNLLPTLIKYKVGDNYKNVCIDFYTMEYLLRYYGNVVIGLDKNNTITVLGYSTNTNNDILFKNEVVNINIKFLNNVIPTKNYKLISNLDNYKSGNCIIIYNNLYHFNTDKEIIDYYCQELSEIKASRFSLILQAKLNTFFRGDVGDTTINEIVTDIYNGKPFIKTGRGFDPEEQIIHVENNCSELLQSLKNEYNNILSEFNNILGINTSYKEKESGLSNLELNGNINFINSNANIYILSRNRELKKLYKRFGVKIVASFREKSLGGENVEKNNKNN